MRTSTIADRYEPANDAPLLAAGSRPSAGGLQVPAADGTQRASLLQPAHNWCVKIIGCSRPLTGVKPVDCGPDAVLKMCMPA